VVHLLDVRAVGPVQREGDVGLQRLGDIDQGLGVKDDHHLGGVVQVGVKVPPLIGALAAARPQPIFPGRDHPGPQPQAGVFLRPRRQMRR